MKIKHRIFCLTTILVLLCSIAMNASATENSRSFVISEFGSSGQADARHAANGFAKLGYSSSLHFNFSKSGFLGWTNSGGSSYSDDNYAFYVSSHGPGDESASSTGIIYFIDSNDNCIYPSDITGNWHLVFIDACNSKRNNNFSSSLNITGHSNRAYLGWATEVGISSASSFNNYFWETYVTRYTIQQAAINAAADVPGAGTTPIRFSGDTSWYGYAS